MTTGRINQIAIPTDKSSKEDSSVAAKGTKETFDSQGAFQNEQKREADSDGI